MSKSAIIHIMHKTAEQAAYLLVRDFGELEKLQVSHKGFRNFVTSADRNTEGRIFRELSKARPEFSFICEESGLTENEDKNSFWIVDPIDGTSNFMRGIPYFAVNIALRIKNEITAGVTLDPMRGECYEAEQGQGAFVRGRTRLRVSGREEMREAVVAVRVDTNIEAELAKAGAILRKTGSVALDLAYLSAGKYDAVIARDVCIWDIASGTILTKEAGGFIEINRKNDKYDIVATSSKKMLDMVLNHILQNGA